MGNNFLGIDWGKRKIGLALAHEETKVALPYGILENNEELFTELEKVIHDESIGTLVIGVPRFEGKEKHPAIAWGEKIAERFSVEVAYQDEMFTSKLAQGSLVSQGYQHVSQKDDAEAAKILLQEWLERK